MNGAKEFDQTIGAEGHRIPRNATMLSQQLTNMGFKKVRAQWTVKFTAEAPDGSGRLTKSIVGTVDKQVHGNGPRAIGGNGQTGLSSAIANSTGGGNVSAVPKSAASSATTTAPVLPSAFGRGGIDRGCGD